MFWFVLMHAAQTRLQSYALLQTGETNNQTFKLQVYHTGMLTFFLFCFLTAVQQINWN